MEDFNSFVNRQPSKTEKGESEFNGKNAGGTNADNSSKGIADLVKNLAFKYDGKNENEILSAIFAEAKKGRENGTLSDSDIDRFSSMLAPMLDSKKCKKLYEICEKLKKHK